MVRSQRLGELLDRKGRIGVHAAIAGLVGAVRRGHQGRRVLELGDQAVGVAGVHMTRRSSRTSSSTLADGRMVRISKIEIIGRKRRNNSSSATNSPIVPTKVLQSQ